MKTYLVACALLLASIAASHSAPAWNALEDKTGSLNVVGRSGDGELRIVIKGRDVKVFTLLKSLERENAPAFDVSTVLAAKKAKGKWNASVDPTQAGTLLEAPNGSMLLADFFKSPAATFSVRVAPPGKLSVVADFSLSGLEDYKAQIDAAQTKPPTAVKTTPAPASKITR